MHVLWLTIGCDHGFTVVNYNHGSSVNCDNNCGCDNNYNNVLIYNYNRAFKRVERS